MNIHIDLSTAILTGVVAAVAAVITALLTRRSQKESNSTQGWAALVKGLQDEVGLLRSGQTELRKDLNGLRDDLATERRARQTLGEVLRSAWSHILRLGDQIRDLGGRPDAPPPDLAAFMRSDGLIVDRVETTISRTTVTDTRDDTPPLEHIVVDMPDGDDSNG